MRITFLILKDYRHAHSLSSGPIGLAYLSAAAKARFPGIHVQIEVDPDRVIQSNPDMVGVSAYTEVYSQSIDAAKHIRRKLGPQVPLLLGGPHINALPKTLAPIFDVGVINEGEQTFVDVIDLFLKNQLTPEHLSQLKGVVYWENGERKVTLPQDLVQDLDQILPPDRSIMRTFWPPAQEMINWPQPIYTSRGCPFKCIFCIFSVEQQKVRYHSVDRVVTEIEDILRHNPRQESISIHDDLFALSKKRLHALTQGIREAGLHKKVSFVCMAKASVFNDDMARLMRDMNVSIVTFGLESGVPRILRYLKGERAKVEENVRAINLCAKHGIRMGGYFIIGTPDETHQELQQAYWFIRDHYPPMSMAGVFRLTPFPGTKFWQEAVERGIVDGEEQDWRPFNYLDMDKKDFLFFNENYDIDTFNEAYEQFCKVMDKNNLGLQTEQHETRLMSLIEPVYKANLRELTPEQKVLEVSGFTRLMIHSALEDLDLERAHERITPWELEQAELDDQSVDLIIAPFALEQSPLKSERCLEKFERWLKPGGQILFFVYNPLQEGLLMRLLSGTWDNELWGFRPFDMFEFMSPAQLQSALKQVGLNTLRTYPLQEKSPQPLKPLTQQALELLNAQISGPPLAAYQEFAYTILTAPKEQDHGRHIQTPGQSGQIRDLSPQRS